MFGRLRRLDEEHAARRWFSHRFLLLFFFGCMLNVFLTAAGIVGTIISCKYGLLLNLLSTII